MIDPAKTIFWFPGNLKKFKQKLFHRVGDHIKSKGGFVAYNDVDLLDSVPDDVVPIVGCHPEVRSRIDAWKVAGRTFCYWDRGYALRIFSTWLPRPAVGSGYYRWEVNAFQMKEVRDVPSDRWNSLRIPTRPWRKDGKHIVVAMPSETYHAFHGTHDWTAKTVESLKAVTDRPIRLREKLSSVPLQVDLSGAHALVTHQSNAAVESVIFGCPVFVDAGSAAALVGLTDLAKIEEPIYPDREQWLASLGHSQFEEDELVNGVLWKLMA